MLLWLDNWCNAGELLLTAMVAGAVLLLGSVVRLVLR
jgi:hypothetical protein